MPTRNISFHFLSSKQENAVAFLMDIFKLFAIGLELLIFTKYEIPFKHVADKYFPENKYHHILL